MAIRESLLWPPEQHPYKELNTIELAKPFNANPAEIGRPAECRLKFADGRVLTDVPYLKLFDWLGEPVSWEAACELTSQRSGLPIQVKSRIE